MNAITTHRTAFKWANEILEMTMADSPVQNWQAGRRRG